MKKCIKTGKNTPEWFKSIVAPIVEETRDFKKSNIIRIKIPKYGSDFHSKQRFEETKRAFDGKHRCRICGSHKDIQIHHLYLYSPKDVIETYEEFKEIPWIPLCLNCHKKIKIKEDGIS